MEQQAIPALDFGPDGFVKDSLSDLARGLIGSEILAIAAAVRRMIAAGEPVCNLTVGDFDARYFPIPDELRAHIHAALDEGETNYPPADGVPELRQAITEFVAREWNASYPIESVLIASGARPIIYAAYRCVVNPGESVVYPVPSWNNNHYALMADAKSIVVETRAEDCFMPTLEQLQPHLGQARLICLNSPLNPTGTAIDADTLRSILEAVVEENARRTREGRRHLFLLHDQIYSLLLFGDAKHHMPAALVPESAPWVIGLDGISKSFAATGLRVGWVLAAPELVARMKGFIGHVGAWAPRPEQVAVARFLRDSLAVDRFRAGMIRRVQQRLKALHDGFMQLKSEGQPVDCVAPQGAIYLSLRLGLIGRSVAGQRIETNEDIRQLLLDRAGLAVVPFQAFGLEEESGWFRLSVGAVSMQDIEEAFPRLRRVLDAVE